eukprot:COSAG04_NODE_4897_length_1836_cov_1.088659_2_plen_67_part_00
MLMTLENSELLSLLDSQEKLDGKIAEALAEIEAEAGGSGGGAADARGKSGGKIRPFSDLQNAKSGG